MGMWDFEPWDNDSAADWYGDLMDRCKIRKEWLKGINADIGDDPEIVRAAVALFVMLGRVYVWPIKEFDQDLELAISKSEALLQGDFNETEELVEAIKIEIEELKSRRSKNPTNGASAKKPWWKLWN